jgi:hypothetical protein
MASKVLIPVDCYEFGKFQALLDMAADRVVAYEKDKHNQWLSDGLKECKAQFEMAWTKRQHPELFE